MQRLVALLVPVVLSCWVHHPILNRFFRQDDFVHLYRKVDRGFWELVLTPHGGHLLTTTQSVLYLLHDLFSMHAAPYFVVVLATHLLNVALLFLVIERITRSPWWAIFGAALWGMSPVNQGSLGWYSVYGHVLVATWMLWILYEITRSEGDVIPSRAMLARCAVLLLAASTSFGVGITFSMGLGVAVHLLLPGAARRRRLLLVFGSIAMLTPLLYEAQHWALRELVGGPETSSNEFVTALPFWALPLWTGAIRLLADLLAYGLATLLLGPLIASGRSGITLGPLAGLTAESIWWISVAVGLLGAAALLGALAVASGPRRLRLLGLLLLAISCYASIALVRLWLGASTFPRYHYAGPMLLAVLVSATLAELAPRRAAARRWGPALVVAWSLAAIVPYSRAGRDPAVWAGRDDRARYERALTRIRRNIARGPDARRVFIRNQTFRLSRWTSRHALPGWAGLYLISYPENRVDGKRVYFVEDDPDLLERYLQGAGRRTRELLVGQADPRGSPAGGAPP